MLHFQSSTKPKKKSDQLRFFFFVFVFFYLDGEFSQLPHLVEKMAKIIPNNNLAEIFTSKFFQHMRLKAGIAVKAILPENQAQLKCNDTC